MQISEISSKEQLKKYLNEYSDAKGRKSLHRAIQNSKRLKMLLETHTPMLQNSPSFFEFLSLENQTGPSLVQALCNLFVDFVFLRKIE